ncbi:hypothetical protein BDF19DRAFT_420226 [Syncephalis fuscata]|nr:hypothetical protein BDF19DRAFT_420226 [Syncephalis fuscata]
MATIRRKPRDVVAPPSVRDLFSTHHHRRSRSSGSGTMTTTATTTTITDNNEARLSSVLSSRRSKRLSALESEEPGRLNRGIETKSMNSNSKCSMASLQNDHATTPAKARTMRDAAKAAAAVMLMGSNGRRRSHPSRDGTITPEPLNNNNGNNSNRSTRSISNGDGNTNGIRGSKMGSTTTTSDIASKGFARATISSTRLATVTKLSTHLTSTTTTTTWLIILDQWQHVQVHNQHHQHHPHCIIKTTTSNIDGYSCFNKPLPSGTKRQKSSSSSLLSTSTSSTKSHSETSSMDVLRVNKPLFICTSDIKHITSSEETNGGTKRSLSPEGDNDSETDVSLVSSSVSSTLSSSSSKLGDSVSTIIGDTTTKSNNNTEKTRTVKKRPSIADLWMSNVVLVVLNQHHLLTRKSLSQLHSSDNNESTHGMLIDRAIEQQQGQGQGQQRQYASLMATAIATADDEETDAVIVSLNSLPGSRMLHSLFFKRPSPIAAIPAIDNGTNTVAATTVPSTSLPRMPSFSNSLEALETSQCKPLSLTASSGSSTSVSSFLSVSPTKSDKPIEIKATMLVDKESSTLRKRLNSPSTTSLISLDESLDAKDALATLHAAVQRQVSEQQQQQIDRKTTGQYGSIKHIDTILPSSDSGMGLESDGGIVQMIDFDLDLDLDELPNGLESPQLWNDDDDMDMDVDISSVQL